MPAAILGPKGRGPFSARSLGHVRIFAVAADRYSQTYFSIAPSVME